MTSYQQQHWQQQHWQQQQPQQQWQQQQLQQQQLQQQLQQQRQQQLQQQQQPQQQQQLEWSKQFRINIEEKEQQQQQELLNKVKNINQAVSNNRKNINQNSLPQYDYIMDGLNLMRGNFSNTHNISQILKDNNFTGKRILIIGRDMMDMKMSNDIQSCHTLVENNNNVDILFINTYVHMGGKNVRLICNCKDDGSKKCKEAYDVNTKFCTNPLVVARGISVSHNYCEIDDYIVFYFALINNAKIISRTENYYNTMRDEQVIRNMGNFTNIPATFYTRENSKMIEEQYYLDPVQVMNTLNEKYKNFKTKDTFILQNKTSLGLPSTGGYKKKRLPKRRSRKKSKGGKKRSRKKSKVIKKRSRKKSKVIKKRSRKK